MDGSVTAVQSDLDGFCFPKRQRRRLRFRLQVKADLQPEPLVTECYVFVLTQNQYKTLYAL